MPGQMSGLGGSYYRFNQRSDTMDPTFGLGGLIGAGVSYFGQQQTNQMQAQMMQQQMQFQERMSSTAYQRSRKDMEAAGLNPMMMFGSGGAASSPAGAPASPNVKSGLDADSIQKGVATAVQAQVSSKTIDHLTSEIAKLQAETATETKRPAWVQAQTDSEREQRKLIMERTDLTKEEKFHEMNKTALTQWQIPIIRNEAARARNIEEMSHSARRAIDVGQYSGKGISDTLKPLFEGVNSAVGMRRSRRYY